MKCFNVVTVFCALLIWTVSSFAYVDGDEAKS